AGDACPVLGVNLDVATLDLHAESVEVESLGEGTATRRDEQVLDMQFFDGAVTKLSFQIDAVARRRSARHLRAGVDGYPLFSKRLLELGGYRFVLNRNQSWEQFEDRDVAAKAIED